MTPPESRLQTAYKIIAVLFALVVALGLAFFWQFGTGGEPSAAASLIFQLSTLEQNPIRAKYPDVDFTRFYPGMKDADIDRVQRECFATRFVYEPHVQFKPRAGELRHVAIAPGGYREGAEKHPWPPAEEDFVVFVFGGSTTFGYGLPNGQTLVAELEAVLRTRAGAASVRCYNFGRGFYDSTQERILFAQLLQAGHVPDVAVFVDGLNDFFFPEPDPILTPELARFMAPDLPERVAAGPLPPAAIVSRLVANHRMVTALGKTFGVATLIVAQPVPFYAFDATAETYPFGTDAKEFAAIATGYALWRGRWQESGPVLWLAEMFDRADSPVYLDQVHYTRAACRRIAERIATSVPPVNKSFE